MGPLHPCSAAVVIPAAAAVVVLAAAIATRVQHGFFCLHVFVLALYGHIQIYLASDYLRASRIVLAISPPILDQF